MLALRKVLDTPATEYPGSNISKGRARARKWPQRLALGEKWATILGSDGPARYEKLLDVARRLAHSYGVGEENR